MTVAAVVAVVNVAVAVASAISGAGTEKAIAAANTRSSRTTADAKNESRAFANSNIAAQNQLKRWIQATSNQRKLDAGGESLGTALTNYRRQKDQITRSNFEDSIRAAEQAGSQAASAATAGITGSVADNINVATILRNDRISAEVDKQGRALDQDYSHTAKAIVGSSIDGLDNSSVFDNFDNNIDVALKFAAPTWFGKFLGQGGAQTTAKAAGQFFTTSGTGTGMGNIGSGVGGADASYGASYGGTPDAY